LRLSRKLAKVDFPGFKGRILSTTLTYPLGKHPADSKTWKDQLDTFFKRFQREFGKTPGIWRLELDKKDSDDLYPHFHLLLFLDTPYLAQQRLQEIRNFVAISWYEVCGKISEDHLSSGTQVTVVRSKKDWEKLERYLSKEERVKDRGISTGRMWGVCYEKMLPISQQIIYIARNDALKLRRWLRRLARKRRGIASLLKEMIFIRYENILRVLMYLDYSLE
jgi:hypothetical protein